DKITAIDGQTINSWEEFVEVVRKAPNEQLEMKIARADKTINLNVTPDKEDIQGEVIGQIGVQQAFEKSVFGTIKYGFEETYDVTKMILTNLYMLITGQYSIDMLAGPVGIYDATDQVVQTGFNNFIKWTAMLSI